MRVDIWWHTGPLIEYRDGNLVNIPVLAEPEHSYLRIDLEEGETRSAVPPLPEYRIAWCDPHVTVRYHVIPVGGQVPDYPGKRIFAHAREPIHVPAGMQVVFSPE